jgi:type I restriction enzyme S subunit
MIPHFKKGDFGKLLIPMIDSDRQIQVGDLYFLMSERIALIRETNTLLEGIARALFESWFIDFEPVRAKAEGRAPDGLDDATAALFPSTMETCAPTPMPTGWRLGTLADLAALNSESWSAKNHPETIAYVDLANAKENEVGELVRYKFEEAPSRARRVLRPGDTIVGTVRPGNRSFAYIFAAPSNLTGSTGFAVLRPKCEEYAEFVYLAATAESAIHSLTQLADGGAYPAVRPEVVSQLPCVIPSLDSVWHSFHDLVKPLFAKIANNQDLARVLMTTRDELLPRLISIRPRLRPMLEPLEHA